MKRDYLVLSPSGIVLLEETRDKDLTIAGAMNLLTWRRIKWAGERDEPDAVFARDEGSLYFCRIGVADGSQGFGPTQFIDDHIAASPLAGFLTKTVNGWQLWATLDGGRTFVPQPMPSLAGVYLPSAVLEAA